MEENLENPTVVLNKTKFFGKILKTWKCEKFYSFKGIRFAVAPLGDLRFKDPLPFEPEGEKYDATEDKHDCPSIYAINPSEDCLFLNVYTNSISSTTLNPVIAFIHPGGLYVGSGLSNFVGPEYLMEKNVVLVTFNYRLGTLGFLNIGTREYPGNAGFKDQVLALRWINKNIANFGGDPKNITLMGYSAGGLSVCLHIVSPMSKNLFHRAVIMSGSIPPQTRIPKGHQRNLALQQVKILGCGDVISNENQVNEIVEYLRTKSAMEISMTLRKMFAFGKDNPMYLWLPVIETDYGQERFLVDDPYAALKNGNFNKIPILIGFTDQEFGQSANDILTNDILLNEFNQKFEQLSPICFMYQLHEDEDIITRKIHEKILNLQNQSYLPTYIMANNKTGKTTTSIENSHFIQLCELFSDSIIRLGASQYAHGISKFVDEIYRYKFSYRSVFTNFNGSCKFKGAEHMDDLCYLFKMNSSFSPNDPEADIIEIMVDFFATFASGIGTLKFNFVFCSSSAFTVFYRKVEVCFLVKNPCFFIIEYYFKLF